MTREVDIANEVWTLVTIKSCTFQPSANMQVTESATAPTGWSYPKKIVLKSKMYDYYNTEGQGLWALSSSNALIEIDDSSAISETGIGYLRGIINSDGGLNVRVLNTPVETEEYEMMQLLGGILKELKIANIHLSLMTDVDINKSEV